MTQNHLREIINRLDQIKTLNGDRSIKLSVHERLMIIVTKISAIEISQRAFIENNYHKYIELIIEILDFHSAEIEIGKHRNTFPVFVKERAEWQQKKNINETLLLFVVAQKIIGIPNYYFKTELIGMALGMLYGFLDTVNYPVEATIDKQLNFTTDDQPLTK